MFKSRWLQRITPIALALAIGSLFVIAVYERLDHSENQTSQEQSTDQYTERAQERISVECAGLDVAASTKCKNEIIQTAEENRRAEQDLKQQTEMAQWAFWMMIASFGGVAITAVGVVYVRFTLDQTVAANKAAQAAVAVTREIGEAQVRAYPAYEIDGAGIDLEKIGETQCKMTIHGRLVNYGETPARGAECHFMFFMASNERGELNDKDMFNSGKSITEIARGKTQNTSLSGLIDAPLHEIRSGKRRVRIGFYISYDDVFGRERQRTGWWSGVITGIDRFYTDPLQEPGKSPVRVYWDKLDESAQNNS